MSRTEFHRLCQEFFSLEEDLGLFDRRVNGVHFWERVRFLVHKRLAGAMVSHEAKIDTSGGYGEYLSGAGSLIKNLVVGNPFLAPEAGLLFYGKGRRKQLEDGLWWDIYIDPIVETVEADCVCFERPYNVGHRRPARTDGLWYTDLIQYSGTLLEKLGVSRVSLSPSEAATLERIEGEIESRFDVEIPLTRMVRSDLAERRVRLPMYRSLLRRVNPRLAFLTAAYNGRETFVEACRAESVPVIELQHGVITRYHMAYSFPYERKRVFPDYFFSFGRYWSDSVPLPLPEEDVYPVGYPYLERRSTAFEHVEPRQQVLCISQPQIGRRLTRLARDLHERGDFEGEIVYKLHPKEYDTWQEWYPELAESEVSVVTEEPPLYRLLAESQYLVGLHSTALFEGQIFGGETFVLDAPGVEYMDYLIENGHAQLVQGADDLVSKLDRPGSEGVDREYFFCSEPADRFRSALADVSEREGNVL